MTKNFYSFFSLYLIASVLQINYLTFCQQNNVNGNLIQFSSDGAWCWYQDERTVVDTTNNKIIVSSNRTSNGHDYADIFDISSGLMENYDLGYIGSDDHNTPGLLIRPDGRYLAVYAKHNSDKLTRYRIFYDGSWAPERIFDWNDQPGGSDFNTTYSNVYYLSSEDLAYNLSRGNGHGGQNFLISTDQGDTWSYGGFLTTNGNVGYVNGYFKYCSNGFDRIDFICTEYHPRDYNTSIYHGFIKNGQTFKSDGTLVDEDIFDKNPSTPQDYSTVLQADTIINDLVMSHCWNTDVQRYNDGTIATIITARTNTDSNNPTHAFIYCRYNGTSWTSSYLGNAGLKLYSSEQDYTGLSAMDPNSPDIIYISTTYDPRDDTFLNKHEIFKGVTEDNGVTWKWTPMTENSSVDNLRPIVPRWDYNHTALIWFRGTYSSAQNIDAAIVGIIDSLNKTVGMMIYLDADAENTFFASGKPLVTTGPDGDQGAADDKWHIRTGFGNGGSVLTSGEIDIEDAPELKTRIFLSDAGIYDIWVNFWANPLQDWRIKAGFNENGMQIFRQMACKQVQVGDHNTPIVLAGGGNTFLYQAYLGRVQVDMSDSVNIFVDDYSVQTGGATRTWYDGISYAKINNPIVPVELTSFTANLNSNNVELNWETKTETNNQGFAVEKYDKNKWKQIGFVKGHGTTTETSYYTFTDKTIYENVKYRLKQIDFNGSFSYSQIIELKLNIPGGYKLDQNYPNPFNPSTSIDFSLPQDGLVKLVVYNSLSQKISTLVNEEMHAGSYKAIWNAQNLPSGIYFYKITINEFSKINKMVLLK